MAEIFVIKLESLGQHVGNLVVDTRKSGGLGSAPRFLVDSIIEIDLVHRRLLNLPILPPFSRNVTLEGFLVRTIAKSERGESEGLEREAGVFAKPVSSTAEGLRSPARRGELSSQES